MNTVVMQPLSLEDREQIRQMVLDASEPIAPFWPMRTMVAQNPIHGLEYLPFDEAVRKGRDLLGGNGYLANEEYRQFYRDGRITRESFNSAFGRVGPRPDGQLAIETGRRRVAPEDVWQLHVLFGFEALPLPLLEWELSGGGATAQFRQDLPEESRKRIIEHAAKDGAPCRENPEKAYLLDLWESVLAALELSDFNAPPQLSEDSPSHTFVSISLPPQRTLSDWIDDLTGGDGVEQINNQLIKWVAAFLDEGLAGWEMPGREEGFYQAWRGLAQNDLSGRLLGTAVQADAMWTNFWGDAAAGWYDAKSGEVTSHVASDALFSYAMNPSSADTPALQWVYRGLVLNSTITAADNRIWLLECRNEEARASAARRLDGDRIWKDVWLICLNAQDGTKLWEQPLDTPPGSVMVSMAQRDGRLVLVTSSANRFHLTCFSDKGGEPLWRESAPWGRDNHGGHMSRPAIVAGNVYVRPFTFRLEDGKPQPQRMPVGGCGTYACTDNALFFRQSTVTVWDRATAKTSTWPRLRPDCWLSTIPADGMLLSPEGGGGCSCGTWLETSLGFKPVKSAN